MSVKHSVSVPPDVPARLIGSTWHPGAITTDTATAVPPDNSGLTGTVSGACTARLTPAT